MPINESNLNRVIKQIREYVKSIIAEIESDYAEEGGKSEDYGRMVLMSSAEYGSLRITGESVEEYQEILNSLVAVAMTTEEHFSQRHVVSLLQNTILRAIDFNQSQKGKSSDERLSAALDALKAELKQPPVQRKIYLQIKGIDNGSLPFKAGNITFLPGDSENVNALIEHLKAPEFKDKSGIETYIEFAEKLAREHYLGDSIAVVHVSAVDNTAAKKLALKELRLHVDVLNHFADMLFVANTRIYLPGEAQATGDLTFQYTTDVGWNVEESTVGPDDVYSFRPSVLQRVEKAGFPEALSLLESTERNPFQNKILASLQWSGRAASENEIERAYLMYAIALESLVLGGDNRGDVTYKVSTRCAHLLGDNLQKRQNIRRKMQELYGVRSNIVHAGSFDVVPSDLGAIHNFAKGALAKVLTDPRFVNMTDDGQLNKWFEEQVLG